MNTAIVVTGIICITLIELFALHLGYDGAILASVVGAIAAIVGYKYKTPRTSRGPRQVQRPDPPAFPPEAS